MGQVFSYYIWRRIRRPKQVDNDTKKPLHADNQLNQQESHYINIPDTDVDTVSVSKPDTVASTPTSDGFSTSGGGESDEIPFVVVDLSNADDQNKGGGPGDKVIQVVAEGNKQNKKKKKVKNSNCSVATTSKESKIVKKIGPYNNMQKLLLVGEGDFSFSASLAVAFGSASNIIATSLNSEDFLTKNYKMFLTNKMELENRGGIVIHDVDAKTMVKHVSLGSLKFDRIIFNFPHAGKFGKTDADLRKHRELIRGFLRSAKKMINEDGEIHITHKPSGFFLLWDIPKIGSDQGLHLIQEARFVVKDYPGYHTKYGFGGDKDFQYEPCKTYKFGLLPNK